MLLMFQTVLLPAILAGALWLAALRIGRGRDVGPGAWGGALAIAVAYGCTQYFLLGWPPFPPRRAIEALFFVAIGAAAFGLLEGALRNRRGLLVLLRAVVIALALAAQFRVPMQNSWSGMETALWIGGAGLWTLLVWTALDRLAQARPGISMPLVLWLITSFGAGALVMGGVASAGQLAGGIAGALGAAAVLSLVLRGFRLAHGAVGVWTLLVGGLLLQGHHFAEVPLPVVLVFGLVPLAAWIGELPGVVRRAAWQGVVVRLIITALPLALAILIAWRAMDTGGEDYGY